MGGVGLIGGIVAQKFDQMAAITNFIVTPLSFLSGTFYSVEALPEPFARWRIEPDLLPDRRRAPWDRRCLGCAASAGAGGLCTVGGAGSGAGLALAFERLSDEGVKFVARSSVCRYFGSHDRSDRPYRPSPTFDFSASDSACLPHTCRHLKVAPVCKRTIP